MRRITESDQRGRLSAAQDDLEEALDIARRTDNRWREAWVALRLARVLKEQGTMDAADELAATAARIYGELGCRVQ